MKVYEFGYKTEIISFINKNSTFLLLVSKSRMPILYRKVRTVNNDTVRPYCGLVLGPQSEQWSDKRETFITRSWI